MMERMEAYLKKLEPGIKREIEALINNRDFIFYDGTKEDVTGLMFECDNDSLSIKVSAINRRGLLFTDEMFLLKDGYLTHERNDELKPYRVELDTDNKNAIDAMFHPDAELNDLAAAYRDNSRSMLIKWIDTCWDNVAKSVKNGFCAYLDLDTDDMFIDLNTKEKLTFEEYLAAYNRA
jgi:hypothetical protein